MLTEKTTQQLTNIYYDAYEPDCQASGPKPVIVAFHGYEGNKESMMALLRKINDRDFILASVQSPNAFFVRGENNTTEGRIGFGWMMRYKAEDTIRLHHETLLSVIEEVAADHEIDRNAIFLIAFSQSVSLNYRFTFTKPGIIRGMIAVCGGIPGDWDQEKYHRSETDVLIIAGETDEFYPLERTRTFESAIARRARSVEFRSFPVGHVFPRDALPLINDWVKARVTAG